MAEYSKETTFWNLLQSKKVIIPIIQRDYAQGRIGQEYLRQRFLEKIFSVLINNKREKLFLDFVYGSTEHDTIFPLDGQQRLTTLWLIHWYLALVCDELQKYKSTLAKFSYQTRVSSRKFCENLCSIDNTYDYCNTENNITEFIKNQHWFYASYEQDPTIQSMMNMLGGTDIEDKENNDIVDGIEEICREKELSKEDIKGILDVLIENSPIRFYLLNMEDKNMPLTDDLYIKMNARGKVLTDFENFKVDLLDYKLENEEQLVREAKDSEESFSHKLDTHWTDLFWCNRSNENKIDGIMMKFFNRYFLDWYLAIGSNGQKADIVTASSFYKMMTDGNRSYQNISVYSPSLTTDSIETLTKTLDGLYCLFEAFDKDYNLIDDILQPYWSSNPSDKKNDSHFYFIPRYLAEEGISKITQQQRVVFHALCLFFNNTTKTNVLELKEWLHFVWNIVENSYIDREQAIAAIRFFSNDLNKLSNSGINCFTDIVKYLSTIDTATLPIELFGRRQLLEEIAKAKRIYQDGELDHNWKDKIYTAEKALFFKGAIAFLFNDEYGQPTAWNNFDIKYNTIIEKFDENGIKEAYRVPILARFFELCTDFDHQLWWSRKVFCWTAKTWKENILIQVDRNYKYVYADNIHHILMNDDYTIDRSTQDSRIVSLSNPALIKYLLDKNRDNREMYIRWPHYALHFVGDRTGILLLHENRDKRINEMLSDGRFSLRYPEIIIPDSNKFWGMDIDMIYKTAERSYNIRWYRESNDNVYDLYLMDENWNWMYRVTPIDTERGERKTYLCFNIEEQYTIDDIVNLIITEFNSNILTATNLINNDQ